MIRAQFSHAQIAFSIDWEKYRATLHKVRDVFRKAPTQGPRNEIVWPGLVRQSQRHSTLVVQNRASRRDMHRTLSEAAIDVILRPIGDVA